MPLNSFWKKRHLVSIALCADFERRQCEIKEKNLQKSVLMEYKFLNLRILEGAIEVVGIKEARLFINDIGNRRGYAKSEIDVISETTYKKKKAEVKLSIAKKLSLL